METVKVTVKSAEKASRLELIIRFIWGFFAYIVLAIIAIFAYLAVILQWLHILFLGKRHPALAKFVNQWLSAMTGWYFYVLLATDERPPMIPEF